MSPSQATANAIALRATSARRRFQPLQASAVALAPTSRVLARPNARKQPRELGALTVALLVCCCCQALAGGMLAGTIGSFITMPFDVVKTRMQERDHLSGPTLHDTR
eukprot:2672134-Pleurochrysis_carterae.AAC.4